MPGNSGVTVVTTLVCLFFYTRGCGCIGHPAFPAPSVISGRMVLAKPRAHSAAGSRMHIWQWHGNGEWSGCAASIDEGVLRRDLRRAWLGRLLRRAHGIAFDDYEMF